FTRPKVMKALAKAGFNQSYTYFTWRNFKHELEEYLTELTQGRPADYMIGNPWPNTPDILPEHLPQGGRPAIMLPAALAATPSCPSTASASRRTKRIRCMTSFPANGRCGRAPARSCS